MCEGKAEILVDPGEEKIEVSQLSDEIMYLLTFRPPWEK